MAWYQRKPLLVPSRNSRYVILVAFLILLLHSILSLTHESYGRATSFSHIISSSTTSPPEPSQANETISATAHPLDIDYAYGNTTRRANATILMLARNSEIEKAARSVTELENKFNRHFGYPWIFMNEVPFSEEFKTRLSNIVSGPISFELIPHDDWFQPDWIDENKATQNRNKLVADRIIYGGSVSYRNMCRFNSGFFYRHPALQKFKWYWRVEPDVHFHCDVQFDPFLQMEEKGKVYGFTISLYEFSATIPTLWKSTLEFIETHPGYVAPNNSMGFISEDGGKSYNLCHFWSNFEIADMDFWRGDAYSDYFDYLDSKGGFYYERWGDAPVHSIAASLFLRKDQIQFWDEIGYEHAPFTHCPRQKNNWADGKCSCNKWTSFDYNTYSCKRKWDRIQ